ncbi:MAG TPA: hypothetical protein VGX91_03495 [Candidatus Cybelea sp.]|nr:hypothetical protein [Candidatus Cybelea sp.]
MPPPKPTPRPPQPVRVVALRQTPPPVHPRHIVRSFEGRAGARRFRAASYPAVVRMTATRPVWDVAGAAGTAVAAAQSNGNATAGSGSGAGARGNGGDAASGTEPCGFVTFSDPHGSQYDARSHGFYVDIRMSVHFADGSSQTLILDYPWYYPDETSNPWSSQNAKNPDFPTRFQPPPESQLAAEPELVRYVVAHSTPDGLTLLKDCPAG